MKRVLGKAHKLDRGGEDDDDRRKRDEERERRSGRWRACTIGVCERVWVWVVCVGEAGGIDRWLRGK